MLLAVQHLFLLMKHCFCWQNLGIYSNNEVLSTLGMSYLGISSQPCLSLPVALRQFKNQI